MKFYDPTDQPRSADDPFSVLAGTPGRSLDEPPF